MSLPYLSSTGASDPTAPECMPELKKPIANARQRRQP
jgi:hypothetical protein